MFRVILCMVAMMFFYGIPMGAEGIRGSGAYGFGDDKGFEIGVEVDAGPIILALNWQNMDYLDAMGAPGDTEIDWTQMDLTVVYPVGSVDLEFGYHAGVLTGVNPSIPLDMEIDGTGFHFGGVFGFPLGETGEFRIGAGYHDLDTDWNDFGTTLLTTESTGFDFKLGLDVPIADQVGFFANYRSGWEDDDANIDSYPEIIKVGIGWDISDQVGLMAYWRSVNFNVDGVTNDGANGFWLGFSFTG